MRAPLKRAAALALATCGFSLLTLVNGCKTDVEKSTGQVEDDLRTSVAQLEQGGAGAVEKVSANLKKDVSLKSSPESQIESNSMLAHTETDAADQLVSGQIDPQRVIASGAMSRMNELAGRIDVNALSVAGYKKLDPASGAGRSLSQITTAASSGVDNGQWVKGSAPIPSMADVNQRLALAQKTITDLEQQTQDLTKKRAEALAQAEKFGRQADATTGKNSVGFYIQSSNQRKEAADDQAKIEQIAGRLVVARQDLETAKLQQGMIEADLASFKQQADALQAGWQNVQKQIDSANALSNALLNGGAGTEASGSGASGTGSTLPADAAAPTTAPAVAAAGAATTEPAGGADESLGTSLAALGTQLDHALSSISDNRQKAIELLNSAFAHYEAIVGTGKLADTLQQKYTKLNGAPESRTLPERRAWQELLALDHPSNFKLREAAVQGRLARLYADQWSELSQRNQFAALLSGVLQRAGLQPPASLKFASGDAPAVPTDVQTQLNDLHAVIGKSDFTDFEGAQKKLNDLAEAQKDNPASMEAITAVRADLAYIWAIARSSDVVNNAGNVSGATAELNALATLAANIGHLQLMANYYGWAVLAQAEGKDNDYRSRLAQAVAERKTLVEANAAGLLPTVLPPGLEMPVTSAASQPAGAGPTSQPSAGPSTQEAAGDQAAPTTAPAETPTGDATPGTPSPETQPADNAAAPATQPAQ